MIQIGTKGMYAGVVGLFDDAAQPLRYQRVPLDARFPDSAEMLQLLAAYQDQLKEAGFEGLGIRPQPHPSGRQVRRIEVVCRMPRERVEGVEGRTRRKSAQALTRLCHAAASSQAAARSRATSIRSA